MDFFAAGAVYRHSRDGRPSELGVFVVAYVGRAPEGFAVSQEADGVAFGWRCTSDETGRGQPLGSYVTADFSGWREVPGSDLPALLGDVLPVAPQATRPRQVWPSAEPGRTRRWWRRPTRER
ncbi:hypothetical protein OG871_02130 [Kitasatospora sp. NBC_00374]|uniref:hypothetical protein n=1 Tax=Kitasatospora sp. NBC_00374 TaxID=2975964 RepID=UPI0030E22859